jgi:hypothetical protein
MSMANPDPVAQALATLTGPTEAGIFAPTQPGTAILPDVKLDRLSVERRVLGHITDEVDRTHLGPRNTLAALTYALVTDENTVHPPAGLPRLEAADEGLEAALTAVQAILEHLAELALVKVRADGSWVLTKLGHLELAN